MSENKPEAEQTEGGNGTPPTEFKLCEVWIRNGQLQLDGAKIFMEDKVRALGTFEYCKDIIKQHVEKEEKSPIITPKGSMMDFARKKFSRKGKK